MLAIFYTNEVFMNRLIKAHFQPGYHQIVAPGTLRFLDFARLQLRKGETFRAETNSREAVLDIFAGCASINVEDHQGHRNSFPKAGSRGDVFAGPPVMLYVPPQSAYEIEATAGNLDIGIFSAPSQASSAPALLEGAAVTAKTVGRDNWARTVYSALDQSTPAERLLAGETLNPSGNWSSYPPHKHDQSNPPIEAVLEEVYFFRVKPSSGFGFIWTYTQPGDPEGFSDVFVVEDGDTVLLPKGYHPVVAAPGYQLHYAWVLAGEERRYGAWADDPRHSWVRHS
jgi:5-deoxy-glucuronate isomerase